MKLFDRNCCGVVLLSGERRKEVMENNGKTARSGGLFHVDHVLCVCEEGLNVCVKIFL